MAVTIVYTALKFNTIREILSLGSLSSYVSSTIPTMFLVISYIKDSLDSTLERWTEKVAQVMCKCAD